MEWKKVKLGEIAEIVNGATPSTSVSDNYNGNIVWITPKDLSDTGTKYIERGSRNITQKGFDSCSTHMIPAYNILMSSRAPIGLLAINKVACCTNQGFKNLVLNKEICDVDFVYYSLKFHIKEIESLGAGTTFKEVSKKTMEMYKLGLPPLPIQRHIASVLSALDRKIALNRAINHNLEAMAKQLYDYWFVQFDFPDANGRPYKSSGGEMVWNERLKREIPKGWEDCNLIDVANITMGQSPEGQSYNTNCDGTIFYQGSTDFGGRFPSIRQYTTAPTRFAKKGDILMSVRAPVGAMNIANNDCCIGRGLSAINSKIGSITHLYHIINDFRIRFDGMNAAGTTFGSITKEELHSLPTYKPLLDVLKKFELICHPIFERQMLLGEEINSLTTQRDTLLPLLMNGQVKVNI